MADKQRAFEILEELESRGKLPKGGDALLKSMRAQGTFKSKRNEDLKQIEESIRNVKDPHALTDDELRGLSNAYTRMKFGDLNDPDGRKRYNDNKPMTGMQYFKRVANDINPKRYADEFPNEFDAYNKMSREEKLAWSNKKIEEKKTLSQKLGLRDEPKAVEVKPLTRPDTPMEDMSRLTDSFIQEEIAKQRKQAIPDVVAKEEADERKAVAAKEEADASADEQRRINIGRNIALQESYVPMRRFLESKLGRNRHALDTARRGVETGKLDLDAMNILDPEARAFVASYVTHLRPYDSKQGFMGGLSEMGRRVVSGSIDMGANFGQYLASFGEEIKLAAYAKWNPVEGESMAKAVLRLRSLEREVAAAAAFKAVDRGRFGTAMQGLADTVPFMIAVMASPFTGGSSAIVAAGSVAEETRTRMLDSGEYGVAESRLGGAMAGATAVLVEKMFGFASSKVASKLVAKVFTKELITSTASRHLAERLLKISMRTGGKVVGTGIGELTEEGIEGFVNSVIEDLAKHESPDVRKAVAEFVDQVDASKDVVAAMSVMGFIGGRVVDSFKKPISQSGAEIDTNSRSLERLSQSIAEENAANPERVTQTAEEINEAIVDVWIGETDKKAAQEILEANNVTVDEELIAQLNQVEEFTKSASEVDVEGVAEVDAESAAVQQEVARLRDIGFDAKAVEFLSGTMDSQNIGQFTEQGGIELLNNVLEPEKIGGHEEFHGAVAYGALNDADIAILKSSLTQTELDAVAKKYAGDIAAGETVDLSEEALADRYGEWRSLGAKEKGVMRKLMDFVGKIVNWAKGRGFKSADDVFAGIEPRLRERFAEGATADGGASFAKESFEELRIRGFKESVELWKEALDKHPDNASIKAEYEKAVVEAKEGIERYSSGFLGSGSLSTEQTVEEFLESNPEYGTRVGVDELKDNAQQVAADLIEFMKRFGVEIVFTRGMNRNLDGLTPFNVEGTILLNENIMDSEKYGASYIYDTAIHEAMHSFVQRSDTDLRSKIIAAAKSVSEEKFKRARAMLPRSYSESSLDEEAAIRVLSSAVKSKEFWDKLGSIDKTLAGTIREMVLDFTLSFIEWLEKHGVSWRDSQISVVDEAYKIFRDEFASVKESTDDTQSFAKRDIPAFDVEAMPTIDVGGVQRSTVNSEGNPIHGTEEGIRNFWEWFGDSKVVDEQGRPLVVYHGTRGEFEEFVGRPQWKAKFKEEVGTTFLTSDYEMAVAYGGGRIPISAYASFKNPTELDANGESYISANFNALIEARKSGSDSAIIRNVNDTAAGQRDRLIDTYIALQPTQIKSTDNVGTFGKDEPRFRHAKREASARDVVDLAARTLNTRAKLTEAAVQKIIDRSGIEGLDAAEVRAQADILQDIARKEFGAKAGEFISIADIKKARIRQRTISTLKKMKRTGIVEGRIIEKTQARIRATKKAEAQKQKVAQEIDKLRGQKQLLRDRGVPESGVASDVLRSTGAITLDPDMMFNEVDKYVDVAIGGVEVKPVLRENIKRSSLAKAMRSILNKHVPSKDRSALSKKIADFAKLRQTASGKLEEQYRKLMGEISAKAEAATVESIRKKFSRTIKRLLTKKNKAAHQELAGRSIAPEELSMVRAFDKATGLKDTEIKALRSKAETLLDLDAADGGSDVDSARDTILAEFPMLKDLSDTELGMTALRALDIYGNMDSMSEAEATEAFDDLMDFIRDAQDNLFAQLLERREEVIRIKGLLNDAIDFSLEQWGTQKNFAQFNLNDPFTMIDELFRDLPDDHVAKPLSKELERELNKARRDTAVEVEEFNAELKDKLKEIYTRKEIIQIDKKRDDLAQFNIDEGPISLRSLMLTVIALRQPDVQARAEKNPNGELAQQMKQLPAMEKKLDQYEDGTNKDTQLMDWMVERIDKEYDRIAAKYKQITGSTLPRVELYFPLAKATQVAAGMDEFHGSGSGVIRGFLKQRVDSNTKIKTDGDVVGRMTQHMTDVYRFLNYSDVQMKIRDTLFSRSIKQKLTEAWGTRNVDDLRSSLITEFMGRSPVKGRTDKWVRNAMSTMIHMALDGNILSAARQIADLPSVAAKMGADFANFFINPMQWRETFTVTRELMNDPKVKAMLAEGGAPQFQIQMRGFLDKYLSDGKAANIARNLIGIVPAADGLSRLLAIGAAYRAAIITPDIAAIEDTNERQQAALDRAILRLEQTLQSPHVADRPRAAREGGSIAKLMTVFTSALTPKIGQTIQEFRSLKKAGFKDKAALKRVLNKILYYHVVAGTLQFSVAYAAGLLFDDDDDWWDKKDTAHLIMNIVTGPMAGMFVFGPIIDGLVRALAGVPTFERSPLGLLSQTVINTGRVGRGYIKQTFTDQDYEEVNKKAMDTFLRMSAPGRLTKKAMEKYLD